MIRVLVVDDSAFARKVIREVLGAAPDIEIVGTARDGLEALEKIRALAPDVVTLDLVMPHLDGIGVLHALAGEEAPRVVLVSMSDADSDLGVRALQLGAFDLVHKPTALATERLYTLGDELLDRVRMAAQAGAERDARAAGGARGAGPLSSASAIPSMARVSPVPAPAVSPAPTPTTTATPAGRTTVCVVGTSTGGPHALTQLLAALPGDFPVPIGVVVHMPPGFTHALAMRLDRESALTVVEASEGLELRPGLVVIARAGLHMMFVRQGGAPRVHLATEPSSALHRPSVDVLFESAAEVYGAGVLAVVLTGMGDDGLLGSRAVRARGGRVLTEAESSCVVYGMPRRVAEAGLSLAAVPLDAMVSELQRYV